MQKLDFFEKIARIYFIAIIPWIAIHSFCYSITNSYSLSQKFSKMLFMKSKREFSLNHITIELIQQVIFKFLCWNLTNIWSYNPLISMFSSYFPFAKFSYRIPIWNINTFTRSNNYNCSANKSNFHSLKCFYVQIWPYVYKCILAFCMCVYV